MQVDLSDKSIYDLVKRSDVVIVDKKPAKGEEQSQQVLYGNTNTNVDVDVVKDCRKKKGSMVKFMHKIIFFGIVFLILYILYKYAVKTQFIATESTVTPTSITTLSIFDKH
jgi:hypothetical protein